MKILISLALWFVFWINLIIFVPVLIIISFFIHSEKTKNKLVFTFCNYMMKLLLIKTEIHFISKETKNVFPVIFVANHVSFFDLFISGSTLPGYPRGFELSTHFNKPFYGWFIKKFGQVPIDPKNKNTILHSIKTATELLHNKIRNFFVMPEGSRTRSGNLGTFNHGAFFLSMHSNIPIVPVIYKNLFSINNANSILIHPGKITVIIGDLIYPEQFNNKEEMAQYTKNYMDTILKEKTCELTNS